MCSLEPLDLRARERVVGEVRERLAAPEVERLGQEASRLGRFRRFCLGDQPFEAKQVDLIRVDPDQVSRLLRQDQISRRRAASAAARRGTEARSPRRPAAGRPQRIDQAVDRHSTVWREQESAEQCALLGTAEHNHAAAVDDFERSQDPKLHCSPRTPL